MIRQARQNYDRKRIPLLDQDIHRNLSTYGRRTLISLGRHIYFSSGTVRGAVEETCNLAGGTYLFDSRSKDRSWGETAERLLNRHDRICDIAGPPYSARSWREGLVRSLFLDGDEGTVWIVGEDGEPYLQRIPSHRIGSCAETVEGGPMDGYRIVDGVIVDGTMRAVAYRVLTGDSSDYDTFIDIPATSMRLSFIPILSGQVRGIPLLGLAAWDMQDLDESRRWELLAQKGAAARVFAEYNEDGEPAIGADYITAPESGSSTENTPSGLWRETIDGGLNTYFKANTGSRLEAVKFDRPSRNQQDFVAQVWREALSGAGLSVDFNLDLSKLGGASLRLLCEKVNRHHCDIQDKVIEPACRAFDFFRLSKFIESKRLAAADDWFEWEYLPNAELTPDKRYDADVTAGNIRVGITTRARGAAKFGEALDDVRQAREEESDDLYTRAERLFAKHPKIPIEIIMARLENDANSGVQSVFMDTPTANNPLTPAE